MARLTPLPSDSAHRYSLSDLFVGVATPDYYRYQISAFFAKLFLKILLNRSKTKKKLHGIGDNNNYVTIIIM